MRALARDRLRDGLPGGSFGHGHGLRCRLVALGDPRLRGFGRLPDHLLQPLRRRPKGGGVGGAIGSDHRDGHAASGGQQAGDPGRKAALRSLVCGHEQPLKIRHEPTFVEAFPVEPRPLGVIQRKAGQGPAQHRRHRERRQDSHGDDHREHVLVQRSDREPDGGDDHLRRAARVHPAGESQGFRRPQPTDGSADEGTGELAEAGDRHKPDRQQEKHRVAQDREVGSEPGEREEDGREQARDDAAQLVVDAPGQDGRLADQNSRHECAEHGVDADGVGGKRRQAHDDEDRSDHGGLADELVVRPSGSPSTRSFDRA